MHQCRDVELNGVRWMCAGDHDTEIFATESASGENMCMRDERWAIRP